MSEPAEWKTVRIDAVSYSKLNEIAGLMTFIFGMPVSVSTIAITAVSNLYTNMMPDLQSTAQDPQKIIALRKGMKKNIADWAKLSTPETFNEINEMLKLWEKQEHEIEDDRGG